MQELFKDKWTYAFIIGVIVFVMYVWASVPPLRFPSGTNIVVSEGDSLYGLANQLHEDDVIRSPGWFRAVAIMIGGERAMKAGEYHLPYPQNVFTLAWRILHGKYGIDTVRVTIPEGFTVAKISNLFNGRFIHFNHKEFEEDAKEGYLFPDTYFIPLTADANYVIKVLNNNFSNQTRTLLSGDSLQGRKLEDIITMASIIESEAQNKEDRKIVSGILWKRLELGLPLQVDAALTYINGKTSSELTQSDLSSDNPYNTYKYRGLTPTPISNPGLESIEAALNPVESPYLFFLTGDDGKMHYSVDFDEHKVKKQKYLGG